MEILSVAEGLRDCAICYVAPEALVDKARFWHAQTLFGIPLQIHSAPGGYSVEARPPSVGGPAVYRVAVGRAESARAFAEAYHHQDDTLVGQLLGFPSCCTAFFREVWTDQRMRDTTWPMALSTVGADRTDSIIIVDPVREANILWRWLGVRAVPHLPCSFRCEATVALGKAFIELGKSKAFQEEMGWLEELLSWPMEWSSLHGIAEIHTPILKLTTNTDAVSEKYVVRLTGSTLPDNAASGLRFPYLAPKSARHKGGDGSSGPKIVAGTPNDSSDARENGFSSKLAMDGAHAPLLSLLRNRLDGLAIKGHVLDLGCGNGTLLSKVHRAFPETVPVGIEIDKERVRSTRLKLAPLGGEVFLGNMFSSQQIWHVYSRYVISIVAVTRFLEVDRERASALLGKLVSRSSYVLTYVYPDGVSRYGGSLAQLILDAGFPREGWTFGENGAIFDCNQEQT